MSLEQRAHAASAISGPNEMISQNAEETAARFVNVQKTYDGSSLVVRNLNLTVRRGEFLTLLGPSGSGKTTTLMMLAGFEHPTGGEIFLNERPIGTVPPHKRNIGMVFQNYALFPHMSVAENLAFPLEIRKRPKEEIRGSVDRALRVVGLEAFGGRRPAQLSGGQQQRIAVARAIIFEPELVLMDEPLGALDKQLREQMQYELKQLHKRLGITVVYVTHDQSEALTMSDRVAVFKDGVIEQIDSPSELYERPATPYVAQFIGENNQLPGTIDRVEASGQCIIRLAGGTKVVASAPAPLQPRQCCLVSLRPERIMIGAQGAYENTCQCIVKDIVYLGDHLRVHLFVDGTPIVAKVQNNTSTAGIQIGRPVSIGWRSSDCIAFSALSLNQDDKFPKQQSCVRAVAQDQHSMPVLPY